MVLLITHHLCHPSLNMLQGLNVFPVVRGPKVNTVLEVWPPRSVSSTQSSSHSAPTHSVVWGCCDQRTWHLVMAVRMMLHVPSHPITVWVLTPAHSWENCRSFLTPVIPQIWGLGGVGSLSRTSELRLVGNIGGQWTVGLDHLGGLFQPWWFYDSIG